MNKSIQTVLLVVCFVLASVWMQGCGCDEDGASECIAKCISTPTDACCTVACVDDNSCCDDSDQMKAFVALAKAAGCSQC